jgi:uncharacterized protein (DUF488 family)
VTNVAGLMGVGYEGASLQDLLLELNGRRVTTLVDVRLNPISRKKGFSKKSLAEFLTANGIAYLHVPALGNPKDNREAYAEVGTNEGNAARKRYRQLLSEPAGVQAIKELASLAEVSSVAVFCYEHSELRCHRHEVLRAARDLLDAAR